MKRINGAGKNFDYTWVIVALCVLMFGSTFGFASRNNGGFYMAAIIEALGINRTAFSITDTIRYVTTTVMSLFFGTLLYRFGTKRMICFGYGCVIIATAINAVAESLWVFYVGSVLLGLGFSFTGTAMAGSVVGKWCKGNRGTIMGIISASNGVAGALATQILVPIIHEGGNKFGYRRSYWLVVAILTVSLILTLLFFREKPFDQSGELPTRKKKQRGQDWVGLEFDEVKRQPWFYLAMAGLFLTGIMLHGLSSVSTLHLLDVGIDVNFLAAFTSVSSLLVTATKLITGISYDRLGLRITLGICNVAAALGMFLLAMVTNSEAGKVLTIVYFVMNTVATPLSSILLSIVASDLVGNKAYDKTSGLFISMSTAGSALGAPLMNAVYDFFGTYQPAMILCGVLMIVVTVMFQYVLTAAHKKREAVEQEMQPQPTVE